MKLIRRGNYELPKTLIMLRELEEEIREERGEEFADLVGLSFSYSPEENDFFTYANAPIDMVLLTFTRVDSYCGFITEFSTIEDLENAPIALFERLGFCDSDYSAKIIANHIRDFLRLLITVKNIFSLDQEDDEKHEDQTPEEEYFYRKIMEKFDLEPFESVLQYKQEIMESRAREVAIMTKNGIGVMPICDEGPHNIFELNEEWDNPIDEIKRFFEDASLESKLACIRNLQEQFSLEHGVDLLDFLIDEMTKLGFVNEVKKLSSFTL